MSVSNTLTLPITHSLLPTNLRLHSTHAAIRNVRTLPFDLAASKDINEQRIRKRKLRDTVFISSKLYTPALDAG